MTCTITIADNGHITFDPPIGGGNRPDMIQAYRCFTMLSQVQLIDLVDIFADAVINEKPVPSMEELAQDARRYRILTGDRETEQLIELRRRMSAMGKGAVDVEIDRIAGTL